MKKPFHITKFSELGLTSRASRTAPAAPPTPVEDIIVKALIIHSDQPITNEVKQPIKKPIDKEDQQQKNKGEIAKVEVKKQQNVSYIRQLKKKANERILAQHLKKRT